MRWSWLVVLSVGCRQLLGFEEARPLADADKPDSATIDSALDGLASTCPANYVALSGGPSLYRVVATVSERLNWVAAEADCRDDGVGTHLAIPQTLDEHTALVDALSGATGWIGVTDRITDTNWIPITGGSETDWFDNWFGGGEPDPNGTFNCVTFTRADGGLEEPVPCEGTDPTFFVGYVCECDGLAVDLGSF